METSIFNCDCSLNPMSVLNDIMRIMDEEISRIKDFDSLLDRVLLEARKFTQSDAGSLFLVEGDSLRFSYVQNDTLFKNSWMAKKFSYSNLKVEINESSIAGYVAKTGKSIIIDDVYYIDESFPFSFNRSFDEQNRYRTQSMLAVPLKVNQDHILGVMELINPLNSEGEVVSFTDHQKFMADLFANEAAMALERAKMARDLILRMIKMAELRDPKETGAHVNRVGAYSMEIYLHWAGVMGISEREAKHFAGNLRIAAMLHDVGKIAIPDSVLKKKGRLTPEEFDIMKLHTLWGARLFVDPNSPLDELSKEIALNHHEKWDGSGYPGKVEDIFEEAVRQGEGKKEEEIPIAARIVSLADVYDALVSKRCYKEAWDDSEALELIRGQSGKHFDPQVVESFFEVYEVIQAIRKKYPDF